MQPLNSELLPREAHNLLLLIDGRKTMHQYRTQLNDMKMFKSVGGVEQYFQLLLDMELIRLEATEVGIYPTSASDIPTLTTVISREAPASMPPKSLAAVHDARRQEAATRDIAVDFSDDVYPVSSFDSVRETGVSRSKISAEMAAIIEQNAEPEDTWSLLMELEGCNSDTELIMFLRALAKGNHGPISKKMASLLKYLKKSQLV